ncbi:MAG: glycoside hydrolase family 9 protein, partial [Chitinispirillaceae bacterium]
MKGFTGVLMAVSLFALPCSSAIHIRYNQAGYLPQRPKSLVLISDNDLEGQTWIIRENSTEVLSGTVESSIAGAGDHTSHPFYHTVDFSELNSNGAYHFSIGDSEVEINVSDHPYSVFITDALRHLRTARSGSDEAFNHGISHLGDSAAIVNVVDGEPSDGNWKEAVPAQTVDLRGGWYDAGDYIKFTLTIATTVYYLLEAYEANPLTFTRVLSTSDLPDVLDEAKHGLDYLMKTYPGDDLFVIQVGNGLDHNQGERLPENDALEGKRPALCAISPVHMGITAAALAKGARIFEAEGKSETSRHYLKKAQRILQRALSSDALDGPAYEKDATNDFYRDNSLEDNMCLGAFELYKATRNSEYLDLARSLAPSAGNWLSWGTYNFSCNIGLETMHEDSRTAAQNDMDYFTGNMDPVWGIPLDYTWASLLCWSAVGAAAGAWNRLHPSAEAYDLHLKMVDLLFGRNN